MLRALAVLSSLILSTWWQFIADSIGQAFKGEALQSIECWNCGFESRREHGYLLWTVCCQVEDLALGRSLIQGSPTESGLWLCDLEISEMRRPWPALGCWAKEEGWYFKKVQILICLTVYFSPFSVHQQSPYCFLIKQPTFYLFSGSNTNFVPHEKRNIKLEFSLL